MYAAAAQGRPALLDQSYIRDPSKSIRDLIRETIGKVRENIEVSRFSRFEVGMSGAGQAGQDGTGQNDGQGS